MSEPTSPITQDDLHAYVDDQLAAERRLAVEQHLAANANAARRVATYQAQRNAIRAAFQAADAGPLPPKLALANIIARRRREPYRGWLVAASVLLALGIGVAGGWLLHAPRDIGRAEQAMARLEQEALTSHAVYAVDLRHPVEVPGSEQPHLQQWLSNRLNRTVMAPDLSALGYRLIGGRLLATEGGGAAALLMYDDASHHRISLLLRPMAPALHVSSSIIGKDDVNGRAWIADGLGIAVVAGNPKTDLAPLATQIGADLGRPG